MNEAFFGGSEGVFEIDDAVRLADVVVIQLFDTLAELDVVEFAFLEFYFKLTIHGAGFLSADDCDLVLGLRKFLAE